MWNTQSTLLPIEIRCSLPQNYIRWNRTLVSNDLKIKLFCISFHIINRFVIFFLGCSRVIYILRNDIIYKKICIPCILNLNIARGLRRVRKWRNWDAFVFLLGGGQITNQRWNIVSLNALSRKQKIYFKFKSPIIKTWSITL